MTKESKSDKEVLEAMHAEDKKEVDAMNATTKTTKAPKKVRVISEEDRTKGLKDEPFVVASYHVETKEVESKNKTVEKVNFFIITDTYGRRMEFEAGANLK